MAIARDSGGSSFPVVTSAGGGGSSGTSLVSTAFSTSAAAGKLVVCVSLSNYNGADMGVPTLSGGGLTWTKKIERDRASGHSHMSQIWTANWSGGALSSVQLTLSWATASVNFSVSITIDALTGASDTDGTSGGATANGSAGNLSVALTGTASGSWRYSASAHEELPGGVTAVTPVTDTTELADSWGFGTGSAAGLNTTGSGSVTVGSSQTGVYMAVCAIEVLAASTDTTIGGGTVPGAATVSGTARAEKLFSGTVAGAATLQGTVSTGSDITLGGATVGGAATLFGALKLDIAPPVIRNAGAWHPGSGTSAGQTTSPLVCTLVGHQTNDLLLVEVQSSTSNTTTPTHSTPSGWTLVNQTSNTTGARRILCSLFARKAASAAETNPSFTVTPTSTTNVHRCRSMVIQAGTWNDVGDLTVGNPTFPDSVTNSGAATTIALNINVNVAPALILASVGQTDDTATGCTNNNSYTGSGTNFDSSTGSDGYSHSATKAVTATGSQAVTFTFTAGVTTGTAGLAVSMPAQFTVVGGGTVAGAATVSGTARAEILLGGTVAGAATLSGNITVEDANSVVLGGGTVAGAATLSGAVRLEIVFAGTVLGEGSLLSNNEFIVEAVLGGTVAGTATVSGTARAEKLFTGTVAGAAALSGGLTLDYMIGGTVQGAATVSGTARAEKILAGGTVLGAAALSGGLSTESLLTGGTIQGTATVSGTARAEKLFSGTVAGTSAASGTPVVEVVFAGTVAGAATLSGSLSVTGANDVAISGGIVLGAATVSGTARAEKLFSGFAEGVASLAGAPHAEWMLTGGTAAGAATLSGTARAEKLFTGTVQGVSALQGSLVLDLFLAGGLALGQATLFGNLGIDSVGTYTEGVLNHFVGDRYYPVLVERESDGVYVPVVVKFFTPT